VIKNLKLLRTTSLKPNLLVLMKTMSVHWCLCARDPYIWSFCCNG